MPPFPGLPDNPKAEGHYLFINKNIIEMLALLALATTTSGRWVGLDGLVRAVNPFGRKKRIPPAPYSGPSPVRELVKEEPASSPSELVTPDAAPSLSVGPISPSAPTEEPPHGA
jgi:hypothetical protein